MTLIVDGQERRTISTKGTEFIEKPFFVQK